MNPARKRQIRLVVALTTAVLLSVALIYTSFNAANKSIIPSELVEMETGKSYDVTGKVVADDEGRPRLFTIIDPEADCEPDEGTSTKVALTDGDANDNCGLPTVTVEYDGPVPDPFRVGREIIVTGSLDEQGVFVGEKDTLITKCPSKFKEEFGDQDNIIYE